MLCPEPGQRILDACAAPGGKAAHLLESCPELDLLALDIDEKRLQKVAENCQRLQLNATLSTADASTPDSWYDGRLFDRILLDAPCSATGIIRRHPDIKLTRDPADLLELQQTQQALLQALWPLLQRQGLLLYATCSIFKEENDQQIARFLAHTPDAEEIPLTSYSWGCTRTHGRQLLPEQHGTDGFYYALLKKR